MAKDYYSILGVNKTSSSDEIKKAYRKLAHEYHPDRNNGDEQCEQKFKEISEAYSVLSNPTKKEQYDNPSSGSFFPDFFNDVFNIHFNYGKKQTRQSKYPPDIQTTLNISLEQAYNGMSLEISFDRYNACHVCNGIGGNLDVCKDCSGSGVMERGNSVFRIRNTCPNCGGIGQNITSSCPNCNNGFNIENKIVAINIPRGCDNNVVIKIHNEGNLTINSKSRGNVFLHIKIQNHDKFTVTDGNLCANISIPFSAACLGGIIPFQHISGEILDIDVKSGTQNGELIRVINKGMPKLHHPGQYDDLLLMAQINVPTQLNEQQRIVIQQLLQNNL